MEKTCLIKYPNHHEQTVCRSMDVHYQRGLANMDMRTILLEMEEEDPSYIVAESLAECVLQLCGNLSL